MNKMKIKKGDNVVILTGKDKGKKGKVVRALPREGAVIVDGLNKKKKTQKGSQGKGSVIEFEFPIDVSNVALLDPKTDTPTRIGFEVTNSKKNRIAKKSKTVI